MTKFMLRWLVGETSQRSVDHRSIIARIPVSLVHDDTHLVRVSTFGGSRGDTSITDAFQGLHSWAWIFGSSPYTILLAAPTAPADRSHAVTLDFAVGATPTGIGGTWLLVSRAAFRVKMSLRAGARRRWRWVLGFNMSDDQPSQVTLYLLSKSLRVNSPSQFSSGHLYGLSLASRVSQDE